MALSTIAYVIVVLQSPKRTYALESRAQQTLYFEPMGEF